jgi:hypothetical protein
MRYHDSSLETRKPIICLAVDKLVGECFDLMAACVDSDQEVTELREKQKEILATLFYRKVF